jgi:hypothetical protein
MQFSHTSRIRRYMLPLVPKHDDQAVADDGSASEQPERCRPIQCAIDESGSIVWGARQTSPESSRSSHGWRSMS